MKNTSVATSKPSQERGLFAALVGVLFPMVFAPLGGAPLLAVRRMGGRKYFFTLGFVLTSALVVAHFVGYHGVWVPFAALFALIAFYSEFEDMGFSKEGAGAASLAGTIGIGFLVAWSWIRLNGLNSIATIQNSIDQWVIDLNATFPEAGLTTQIVMESMPSGIVCLMILTLWLALLLEGRFRFWMGASKESKTNTLSDFQLPTYFVWIAIASVSGAYLVHDLEKLRIISVNVLNVLAFLYFLQGLSVVATYFRVTKTGKIWQAVWYFLLVFQMAILVAALGFLEFWFEFRNKLNNKVAQSA